MDTWYLYAGFLAFVVAMLAVDLKFFHAKADTPSVKESGAWVAVWVGLGVIFGASLLAWRGTVPGFQYFAGYLIEYSLSVDNLFVFIVIFSYFGVPPKLQRRVLFFGILGAIVFRGVFIAVGTALIHAFDWIIYVFGALLIATAFRVAKGTEEIKPERNPVLRFFQKRLRTTASYHGQKFFVTENGNRLATPLFIVLIFIETTDIVFAVDSIPAIFAITRDPFIVLTSNVFAVLGLRALYFLLAGSMTRLHYLKYGLAVILAFVGLKMLASEVVHIPTWASLTVVVAVLGATTLASLMFAPDPDREGRRRVEERQ